MEWCKGMRIDEKNKVIITWTNDSVCFNELTQRQALTDGVKSNH